MACSCRICTSCPGTTPVPRPGKSTAGATASPRRDERTQSHPPPGACTCWSWAATTRSSPMGAAALRLLLVDAHVEGALGGARVDDRAGGEQPVVARAVRLEVDELGPGVDRSGLQAGLQVHPARLVVEDVVVEVAVVRPRCAALLDAVIAVAHRNVVGDDEAIGLD